MKSSMRFGLRAAIVILLFARSANGHDNAYVHPLLTKYAFSSWAATGAGTAILQDWNFDQNITYTSAATGVGAGISLRINDWDGVNLIGWINAGSKYEDTDADGGERRCLNHFYDPLAANAALNDPAGVHALSGNRDSYVWATQGAGLTGPNEYTWAKARERALASLVGNTPSERSSATADTFFVLGKVIHLNQDLSQPEHTRNDAHCINGEGPMGLWGILPKWRWIENYGQDACEHITDPKHSILKTNMEAAQPLDWSGVGFKRLKDFWDTNLYDGTDATALDADANNTAPIGLAEFSNGNFLGADATYKDFEPNNKTFPYPRIGSTTYEQSPTTVPLISIAKVKTLTMQNGASQKYGLFLEKVKDGVTVEHHSAMLYSKFTESVRRPPVFAETLYTESTVKSFTVQSVDVLKEYHEILLPKAISYSAGILDYFFRGKLSVASGRDNEGLQVLTATNNSGSVLLGGVFTIYSEDSSHNRSMGPTLSVFKQDGSKWTATSTLPHGESVTLHFSKPNGMPVDARVIYQGTIGVDASGAAASDPDDEGMALATHPTQIYTYNVSNPIIEWDTTMATKYKVGYPEYPGHISSPPKIYLNRTLAGELAIANYYEEDCGGEPAYAYHGGHEAWVYEFNGTGSYDYDGNVTKANGITWTSGAFNGFGAKPPEYKYEYKIDYITYSTGGYAGGGCTSDAIEEVLTATTRTLTGLGCTPCSNSQYGGAVKVLGTASETQSNEYTTAQLKLNTASSLAPLDGDWNDSWGCLLDLNASEEICKIQKGRYRIHFPLVLTAPANAIYTVSWVERFIAKTGSGLTSIDVKSAGIGYTTTPIVTISAPPAGGTQATANAQIDERGCVTRISIVNPGSGYKSGPSVTLSGSSTIQARAVAHLGTETSRTYSWTGAVPANYNQNDYTTWPIAGDGTNPFCELSEPQVNGDIRVELIAVSYQIPSP